MMTLYVAGGCFWGMEELFRSQPGVVDTDVGYMGGENNQPTYEYHPGHAEVLKITYDPMVTTDSLLLDFFFRIHDPTTLNRQGNDIGSSYRSTVFCRDDAQRHAVEAAIERINHSGLYHGRAVTTIEPLTRFWPAEEYHQNYLQKTPEGYSCHYLREAKAI